MREYELKVNPFRLEQLQSVRGFQAENRHGVFHIRGVIPPGKASEYLAMALQDVEAELVAVFPDRSEKVLFRGIVTDTRIDTLNNVHVQHIEITSGTFALDRMEHTRTFQSAGITYDAMLSTVTSQHAGADFLMSVGQGAAIPGTVVQYHETDWAFAKRLASHWGTVLLPNSHLAGKNFYFGTPPRPAYHVLETGNYCVERVRGRLNPNGGESGPMRDMLRYVVREREIYHLGDCLVLNGQELCISAIETALCGSELYHTYSAKPKEDFYSPKVYNYALIGASLHGKVLSVQKDVVTLTVLEDENAGHTGTRWYTYSTVYSSPDGTGWYCMPEPGDSVRFYFPTMDEAQAYVVSSTHVEAADRSIPDNKSIKNKQQKEALFMPNKALFTNNKGMSVIIDDAEGITIVSNKNITIEAKDLLQVISGENAVSMVAAEEIAMKQGTTTFSLAQVVSTQGSQVRLD